MDGSGPSPIPWSDFLNSDYLNDNCDDELETIHPLSRTDAGGPVELALVNVRSPGRRDESDSSLQHFSPPEELSFCFSQQTSQVDQEVSTQSCYIDYMQLTEGDHNVLDCVVSKEEEARLPSEPFPNKKPDSPDSPDSPVPRKRRKVFSRDARLQVQEWLDGHADCPYPSTEEKARIAQEFDLTLKQVSGLFNNMRRRSSTVNQSPTENSMTSSLPITISKGYGKQTPIEQYLSSSPEEDPQPIEVVANAAATFKGPPPRRETEDVLSSLCKKQRSMIRQNSEHSGHSSVSGSTAFRVSSRHSSQSVSSCTSGKRGKRRITTARPSTTNVGRYWCTTCWTNFTFCGSWRRHEKTVCNPQQSFECRMAELKPTAIYCFACLGDSRCQGLLSHYYKACQYKTQEARTFRRRDQFQNHLLRIHNAVFTPTMESWVHAVSTSNESNNKRSSCGFCGNWFLTWEQRLDHIENHYRSHSNFDRSKWHPTGEDEGGGDIGGVCEEKQKDASNGSIPVVLRQQSVPNFESMFPTNSVVPAWKTPDSFHELKDSIEARDSGGVCEDKQKDASNEWIPVVLREQSVPNFESVFRTNSVVPQAPVGKTPDSFHELKDGTEARDSVDFEPSLRNRLVIPPLPQHFPPTFSTIIEGSCKSDVVLREQSVPNFESVFHTNSVVPQAPAGKTPDSFHEFKDGTEARDSVDFEPSLWNRFVIPPIPQHFPRTFSTIIEGSCKSDVVSYEAIPDQPTPRDPWGY